MFLTMRNKFSKVNISCLALCWGFVACSTEPQSEPPTYHTSAKAIIDAKCAGCHQADNLGPFPLTTFEEVERFSVPAKAAIESGAMPPWQPADGCSTYDNNTDLTPEERKTLLAFFDKPVKGEASLDSSNMESEVPSDKWTPDLTLSLPTPFKPTVTPDDYRCQLIEWPLEEEAYVTAFSVTPDQRAIVHHTIVFVAPPDQAESFRAMDEAEDGPGYTCFGGPSASSAMTMQGLRSQQSTGWLGSWVPGGASGKFPDGLGIRVEPGSLLIVQMHYNLLNAESVADQSKINVAYAKEVEKPAMFLPFTDIGWVSNGRVGGEPMTIPAGEANVEHSTTLGAQGLLLNNFRQRIGADSDESLVIYNAGAHMHTLGQTIRIDIERPTKEECVLDIQDWDFNWQGNYQLSQPKILGPEDKLRLSCSWDNSAANQIMVEGALRAPTDVQWGEGTTDEMCLGVLLVAKE